jgi:hypothetical protein
MPKTIPFVSLTGPLDVDKRYTLYPATGDLLAVQVIVTECGLSVSFCAGVYQLRSFPHPAETDSAAKETRKKPRRAREEWNGFLIRKAEPQPSRACGSRNSQHAREIWWTAGGSNPRPHRCERCALPAELAAHGTAAILAGVGEDSKLWRGPSRARTRRASR